MSLQRKCLAASAISHGCLLALVFVASAFIPAKPKEDVVSLDLVDLSAIPVDEPNVVGGGNPNAGAAAPAIPKAEPVQQQPAPAPKTETKPEPKVPEPVKEPAPEPKPKEPVKEPVKQAVKEPVHEPEPKPRKPELDPDSFKISQKAIHKEIKPAKPALSFDLSKAEKRTIKPSTRSSHSNSNSENSEADARAERESKLAEARAGALSDAMSRLQGGLSKGIGEIGVPGPGGQAYASYGLILRKYYEKAWIPPTASRGDEPVIHVQVVIRKDGTVLSRRILRKSGRSELDRSVQRALDRVNKVPEFPSGSTDEQRTFDIDFNLTDKIGAG
jgi:TonB family protein